MQLEYKWKSFTDFKDRISKLINELQLFVEEDEESNGIKLRGENVRGNAQVILTKNIELEFFFSLECPPNIEKSVQHVLGSPTKVRIPKPSLLDVSKTILSCKELPSSLQALAEEVELGLEEFMKYKDEIIKAAERRGAIEEVKKAAKVLRNFDEG